MAASPQKVWNKLMAEIAAKSIAPSDVDWARIAAFIDGEGCISIKTKKGRRQKSPQHCVYVTIINTDARLIRWLSQTLGVGSFYTSRFSGRKENWKLAFRFELYGVAAQWVLENCLPYFIIKREQAEVALQMQASVNKIRLGPGTWIPPTLFQERDEMKEQLHALKREVHPLEVV